MVEIRLMYHGPQHYKHSFNIVQFKDTNYDLYTVEQSKLNWRDFLKFYPNS